MNQTSKSKRNTFPYNPISIFILAIGLLFLPSAVTANEVDFSGMLRSYTAGRFSESDIAVAEQTSDFTIQGWGDISKILVNPYAYVGMDGEPEIGIREAYIDLFLPSLDLRIGKQAIVWGQAEGAFITDIVSPQDLRGYILSDFDEIRMGIPAVKGDYYLGSFTLEAVWLPGFVPTSLPSSDSIWAIQPDFSWAPGTVTVNPASEVDPDLENGELFTKISYFGSTLNAEIMAGYSRDDKPVMQMDKSAAPDITVTPVFKNYTVLGGSFSSTIASAVLRTEAAVYLDRAFNTTDPAISDGIIDMNQLHGLAGVDWSFLGTSMSAQYIVQYIQDYNDFLFADEYNHMATFRVRDSFLSDTLTLELFAYMEFDPGNALLRPSVTWSMEDGVELKTGAEIFLGDDEGTFGMYGDNTMAYVSLRWYF